MTKKNSFTKVNLEKNAFFKSSVHYFIVYFILYPYFKLFHRVSVEGRENIPKNKSLIVASNHLSYYDPLLLSLAMKKPVSYMAKEELFKVPVLSFLIRLLSAFAVDRKSLDISTIKSAKKVLKTKNWYLGIFPEGTRVMDGTIGNINKGFGYLAKATKSDVLPVGITGADKFLGKITVKIGKPLQAPSDPDDIIVNWGNSVSELTGFAFETEKENSEQLV